MMVDQLNRRRATLFDGRRGAEPSWTVFALCMPNVFSDVRNSDSTLQRVVQVFSVEDLRAHDDSQEPACVVVDADEQADVALAVLHYLRPVLHRRPVIVLTDSHHIRTAVSVMRAGAFDVVEKPVNPGRLAACIDEALRAAHDAEVRSFAPRMPVGAARLAVESLTPRQRDILGRIVRGHPNKIIAADLGISQRTAENHRAAIMRKLGVTSISALIQTALAASAG